MKPIEFPEQNVVYGENQPEYDPLPAHKTAEGQVVTVWQLSDEERKHIAETGLLYFSQHTFNHPIQPVFLTVNRGDLFNE